ncbi:hypothetical protein FA95DRAFT_1601333 [Auriscalpium vulgare]|uniref:Uncharacterized protein n=1 Tax=Auriscalpium vulgare TaxID=40419 RepID=A0ACB8SAP7_9AGAM|nr:hypothetical protein FA95DRAFT_1601333 [Auriscalpium vulgare]
MASDITKKMWGIFDETGIFLSLCRHGFALLILDMVQSGELLKYGFATVEKLLNTFGAGLGGGYDIGCKFGTSINNSPLGPLARSLSYQSLVGAFHGYAHNRKCQLKSLAKYKTNLGLEDLEGCERAFSRSNPLAPTTRYASAFHRQQDIATHYEHADNFEVYANLSDFLCNNYKQALSILQTAPGILADTMKQLGIVDRGVFDTWLSQERAYLEGLKSEPTEDTLEMEYYQSLVHMHDSEAKLLEARAAWATITPQTIGMSGSSLKTETARRQAIARNVKTIEVANELELRMGIKDRWLPKSRPWLRAQKKVALRTYRKAVDALEALVVARIFELSKMNMAQTGYKLRKHIAKALQARSQAVRSAVDRYNNAAAALKPPRRVLQWADVIEYAFLSDFDLLRDARQDVSKQMWATPVGRVALDQHFTILRAAEEIVRLNVEIPRVVTYIRDEGAYLRQRVIDVRSEDPHLAHQIALFAQERGRFNEHHTRMFTTLAHTDGFTGSISPGTSVEGVLGTRGSAGMVLNGTGARETAMPPAHERIAAASRTASPAINMALSVDGAPDQVAHQVGRNAPSPLSHLNGAVARTPDAPNMMTPDVPNVSAPDLPNVVTPNALLPISRAPAGPSRDRKDSDASMASARDGLEEEVDEEEDDDAEEEDGHAEEELGAAILALLSIHEPL